MAFSVPALTNTSGLQIWSNWPLNPVKINIAGIFCRYIVDTPSKTKDSFQNFYKQMQVIAFKRALIKFQSFWVGKNISDVVNDIKKTLEEDNIAFHYYFKFVVKRYSPGQILSV